MLDKNVELLKYLTDIRKEFDAYHNHKELMVWFGVVLFIGLLTMIINAKVPENTNVPSPALNLFKSFGIILFTVIVCAYTYQQLLFRNYAADVYAACARLSAEILAAPEAELKLDLSIRPLQEASKEGVHAVYYLPEGILSKKDEMKQNVLKSGGSVGIQTLERLEYILIFVSSAFAIVWVWIG